MTSNPITEFASLRILSPHTLHTPTLRSGFLTGSNAQTSHSGYPLHFFSHHKKQENQDECSITLYIISGWQSIQAHEAWIASPTNQEIMARFGNEALAELENLAHLDIDFTEMRFEECRTLVWRKRSTSSGRDGRGDWEGTHVTIALRAGANLGVPSTSARVLWSYRGCALDVDVEEEYELTAYSGGELPSFSEDYTVVHMEDFTTIHSE